MKNIILLLALCTITSLIHGQDKLLGGQQTQYNVSAGNGNGLRFWNSDAYKIHMGNSSEYKFGPVTDYSIKMNMSSNTGRGWTWGVTGATPVAALSNKGDFKIAGSLSGNLSNGALRVKTSGGTLDIGAQNTSWAHIYTDRPKIIFNKDVYTVSNAFSSYNNDLIFKTKGTERIRIKDENGYVGIGTNNPYEQLQVGNAMALHDGGHKILTFMYAYGGGARDLDASKYAAEIRFDPAAGRLLLGTSTAVNNGPTARMTILKNGYVGIGTTAPDAPLAVNGKVHSKEVKVDLNGWADYVFAKDYQLPSLEEVAQHIQNKGHLINIPSEKEVLENGIHLGEMNAKLLEKIEELTLYTIAQEKKLHLSENKLQALETANQQLEKRLAIIETLLEK